MKYMGSKRTMLSNGLGELIKREAAGSTGVVDLFCGAGSISWFAAQNCSSQTTAVDLQEYAVVLAKAVISRDYPVDSIELANSWLGRVVVQRNASELWREAIKLERHLKHEANLVFRSRELCESASFVGPMWNAYGGHYFSASQAITLDYMLANLPGEEPGRALCLSATIIAASKCAAAPGHTAQPFQPTEAALPHLYKTWALDPISISEQALQDLCGRYAEIPGDAYVGEAHEVSKNLDSGKLAIVDPPYSSVQYSRFYHVLETIARGQHCESVSGVGRYPPLSERPQSDFSKKNSSHKALKQLIGALAESEATVILTFPDNKCSNGLSGESVRQVARDCYEMEEKVVAGKFSTLGGNNVSRKSRAESNELILLMRPRGH